MAGNFRAAGLASGMDSNAIVDALVKIQRAPIEKLATVKRGVEIKLSGIANFSKLVESFKSAVTGLADTGARGVKSAQTPTAVDVTTSSSSMP